MAWSLLILWLGLTGWVPNQGRPGQTPPGAAQDLASGTLLVASRTLRDPNFSETVVFLTDYADDGAAGLVVNVPTDVRLAEAFTHLSLGANGARTVFAGGPVARGNAVALVRSRPGAAGVRTIVPGVDVISTRDRLEQTVTGEDPSTFRVYLGRAGWAPGQLAREVEAGAWHLLPAAAELVFDDAPTTLWRRLIRRTELLQAAAPAPRPVDQFSALTKMFFQ